MNKETVDRIINDYGNSLQQNINSNLNLDNKLN